MRNRWLDIGRGGPGAGGPRFFGVIRLILLCAASTTACSPDVPERRAVYVPTWEPVMSARGRESTFTDVFAIEATRFRVRWQVTDETADGSGRFRAWAHSGDSGRPIAEVVELKGGGSGTTVIEEDPRRYYLAIEASGVAWSVEVEEQFPAPRR